MDDVYGNSILTLSNTLLPCPSAPPTVTLDVIDPEDVASPQPLNREAISRMSAREYSLRAQAAVAESDEALQGLTEEDVRGCECGCWCF